MEDQDARQAAVLREQLDMALQRSQDLEADVARLNEEKAELRDRLDLQVGLQVDNGLLQFMDIPEPEWLRGGDRVDVRIRLVGGCFDPTVPFPRSWLFSEVLPAYKGNVPRCSNLHEVAVLLKAYEDKGSMCVNQAFHTNFRENNYNERHALHALHLVSELLPDQMSQLQQQVADKGYVHLEDTRWDPAIDQFCGEEVPLALLPYILAGSLTYDDSSIVLASTWAQQIDALMHVRNEKSVFLVTPMDEATDEEKERFKHHVSHNNITVHVLPPPFTSDTLSEYLRKMWLTDNWLKNCSDKVITHFHLSSYMEPLNPSTCLGYQPHTVDGHLLLRDVRKWSKQTRALLAHKEVHRFSYIDNIIQSDNGTEDMYVDAYEPVVFFPR